MPPNVFGGESVDAYLSLVLEARQKTSPSMKELSRSEVDFGSNSGRELDTSWTVNGAKFRGFSVACKSGLNYYMLTGWCADNAYSQALPAFQSLERMFQIGTPLIAGPPEIPSESDAYYYDLVSYNQQHKKLPNGTQTILAQGMHEGTPVGFELSLGPDWRDEGPIAPNTPLSTYIGKVSFRSVGAESDSLIRAFDQLYETGECPKRMKTETTFSALSLEGPPASLRRAS